MLENETSPWPKNSRDKEDQFLEKTEEPIRIYVLMSFNSSSFWTTQTFIIFLNMYFKNALVVCEHNQFSEH